MLIAQVLLSSALSALPPARQVVPARRHFSLRAASQAPGPVEGSQTIVVGTQRLHRCTLVITGYCGHLTVPLNWLDAADGTIKIRYQWIPAGSSGAKKTIVAEEGGPGYATTGTGYEYKRLFVTLLGDHNLLMMDQRGTGDSAPIFCKDLQPWGGIGGKVPFPKAVAECGDQLNSTYKRADGTFVHASDLFGTSQSVRDLAAILAALQQGPVDFYGDSYGSFFGQVFASRYPDLLRSVVLDSTYPTIHQDPFDTAGQDEIRFGFSVACERSLACEASAPSSALERIHRLEIALDQKPLDTISWTPIGKPEHVHMRGSDIEIMLAYAGDDEGPYRNLDAAARAYLERGDSVPLARLFTWTTLGPAFTGYGFTEFSEGMYVADTCTVYLNAFHMNESMAERRQQYEEAVADLPPHWGYPLSNHDVVTSASEGYDQCITWPAPVHQDPIITKQPPLVPATLPVMILSGDLDETTSPGDARQAAAQLGSSVQFISLRNEIHAPALFDPFNCAQLLVREFVTQPRPLSNACGYLIPEIRTVGVFPLAVSDQPIPTPLPGNTATSDELRLAGIALEALGDGLQAALYAYYGYTPNCGSEYCGPGMRGGSFTATAKLGSVTLTNWQYSADSAVSGNATIRGSVMTGDPGFVNAQLTARAPKAKLSISLVTQYDQRLPRALATISGRASDGRRILATMPAP